VVWYSSCCCGARRVFVDCRVLLQLLHVGNLFWVWCHGCRVVSDFVAVVVRVGYSLDHRVPSWLLTVGVLSVVWWHSCVGCPLSDYL
jgi:hypothetical protein